MAVVADRFGGLASLAAAAIWFLVWLQQRVAHGTTQIDEKQLAGGLTWMDSGKFLVVAFVLVLVGLVSLARRTGRPLRLGRNGATFAVGTLGLLIVATVLEFWTFPWGSYTATYENASGFAGSNAAGAFQALVSLLLTVAFVVFGVELVRAKVMPAWLAIVLVLGGFFTVFLSPVFLLPGLAWLVLGLVLVLDRRRAAIPL
jgi:hypothetical protein